MTSRPSRPPMIPGDRPHLDRTTAARLLRAARAASADDHSDAIDWALASLPDSRPACRLAIRRLLLTGDFADADALIARGLLKRPTDTPLTFLRAESLHRQGKARQAEQELQLVLRLRPHHIASLRLGARIVHAVGNHAQAVQLLRRADTLCPCHDAIQSELVLAHVANGDVERALATLNTMWAPSDRLRAAVYRAQGRLLDALALLEKVAGADDAGNPSPDGGLSIQVEIMDLMEQVGDMARLSEAVESVDPTDGPGMCRAGRVWLLTGAFKRAAVRLAALRRPGPQQREALGILVVAASMLGRTRLAERALTRLQRTVQGADPDTMVDLWRRAMTAKLFGDQASVSEAGRDRNATLLQPMVRSALAILDREQAVLRQRGQPQPLAVLELHRATCLSLLGQVRAAAVAASRSAPARDHSSRPSLRRAA